MSLTVSYAQHGKPSQDTIKSYGVTELRYIATGLVEGKTCDTLLSIANSKLKLKDTIINEKDIEIDNLNNISFLKDQIIDEKDLQITIVNSRLATEIKKHKWTKYGWLITSVFLGGVIIYTTIH